VANVQSRIGVLFAVFFGLLAIAAGRTLYLGVLHSAALRRAANTQQVTIVEVPAQRGTITDRHGTVLAISEPADDISIDPYLVKADPDLRKGPLGVAEELAPLVGSSQATVLRKVSEHSGFVYLAKELPAARAKEVMALKVPGVNSTPTMRQVYPRNTLAAQVLGMMGEKGGLSGVQYADNAILQGKAGERRVVSDAYGQPISITNVHREAPGAQLRLTLDANIQQRAEAVLSAVGKVFHPKDATAIVMQPDTGALLAMASWPQLSLDDPPTSKAALEAALENRGVSFNYEPGSTFKVVAVSGALQKGLITPHTEFDIPDQIQVANRTIHDAEEHPEEMLTTAQILAQSSNVGAITIGKLEGEDTFNEWVHRFGFGARTGVDLPGEEMGKVLNPSEYSGSSMGNLPIGQGELVTPIQMVSAYAALANGGILRTPHIVAALNGHPTKLPQGHRIMSASVAAQVRQMLRGVLAPGGTASEVAVPGYTLAGKTGTASKVNPETGEYSETAYVASFIGFAPASDPKLLCAVIVDEPQDGSIYGGTVAAPAFGQIMDFALPYLGIPPG
jgi:cell division protein FtsI (penicillin-binding protein 3)